MTKHYLYVMDPLQTVDPSKDTTFDFMLESESRGITNWATTIDALSAHNNMGNAIAHPISVRRPSNEGGEFYTLGDKCAMSFNQFSAIFMRKDPPVDDAYIAATHILDQHDYKKTCVFNNPTALRSENEKLSALRFPDLIPATTVSSNMGVLKDAAKNLGKCVLKPVFGHGGKGVFVFEANDPNIGAALELLTNNGQLPAIVQEYLPDAPQGDKRIIILNGEAIGAVLRVPQSGHTRANLHVGGKAIKTEISESDRKIVKRLAPSLQALGLYFVGIDVIGGMLTEINFTSPTGVQEIDRLDKRQGKERISAQVMDFVEKFRYDSVIYAS